MKKVGTVIFVFATFCLLAWVWPDIIIGPPPTDYYKVTFVSLIDIVFKILLAFYLSNHFTEKNNKNGKKIDASVKLIDSFMEVLNALEKDFEMECNEETKKRVMTRLKAMDNYLDIAEREAVATNYIKELKEKRQEIDELVDNIHNEPLSCREKPRLTKLISESSTYLQRSKFDLFK